MRRAQEMSPVNVVSMAALTKGRDGREMTEIGFLLDGGAVAFTDGDRVTRDTKVLSRAFTYARSLNALVIAHPQEPGLSKGRIGDFGQVCEPSWSAPEFRPWPNAWASTATSL